MDFDSISDTALISDTAIRVRIRLDFRGTSKPGRFIFGGRSIEKAAEEAREQNMAMFRNVPMQGIYIQDVDVGLDVYTVYDDVNNIDVAYAPVILELTADTLENLLRFIARDDFRKIEVLSPGSLTLHRYEIERLLFKVFEEMKNYKSFLERKYNLR